MIPSRCLRNAWYVAAWSSEVGRGLFVAAQRARKLLSRLLAEQAVPAQGSAPLHELRRSVGHTCNRNLPVV